MRIVAERYGDVDKDCKLEVTFLRRCKGGSCLSVPYTEDDLDMVISISKRYAPGTYTKTSIRFCSPEHGGNSPCTHRGLWKLMKDMEFDNIGDKAEKTLHEVPEK